MVSTIPFDWGGSEELWAAGASYLASQGVSVSLYKQFADLQYPRLVALRRQGVTLKTPSGFAPGIAQRVLNRFLPYSLQVGGKTTAMRQLVGEGVDLAVISQGWNRDGADWAQACREAGLPYVLISHQASLRGWPTDEERAAIQAAHVGAVKTLFVAERLRTRTEEMVGVRLANAELVRNPYKVPFDVAVGWPESAEPIRLACVGRLEFKDKGQDILVRVMGQEKWRQRPIEVVFYGAGINRDGLQALIELEGAKGCRIHGTTESIEGIWSQCHALVLPSREEGLPLVVVEAMLCGRPCIVTDIAGNAELLTDGESGFVCPAPSAALLDATLERAWDNRDTWREMGRCAAERVRTQIPRDAGQVFGDRLRQLLNDLKSNPEGAH